MEDAALLQEYARTKSEPAFAALVERHIGLVYSAAWRQMRDPQLAEDVTQAVFLVLARKAGQLSRHQGLSGWLLKATHYASTTQMRAAIRRSQREQEAYMQSILNEPDSPVWKEIAPLLDEAMASLGETDRNVLALRFFENKTAEEIGRLLKLNEEAAQKRVRRALEKLRKFFGKRGVVLTAAVIASSVSANSVQAAPASLPAAVMAAVATGATISATMTVLVNETMKTMTWLKLKFAVGLGTSVLLAAGVVTVAISRTGPGSESAARTIVNQTNNTPKGFSLQVNPGTNTTVVNAWTQTVQEAVRNLLRSQKPVSKRDQQLQNSFLHFPLLTAVTNSAGRPAFETLTLTNPVLIGGKKYYGFRFNVPPRTNREDLVWSFVLPEPPSFTGWYILPQTGRMEGFENYFYIERNIFPDEDALTPSNGSRLILQSLSGDALENGQSYLIWFGFKGGNPAHVSLAFTFANLQTNGLNAIANVLALNCQDYIEHPLSPPIVNPDNQHIYILLRPATWEQSEAQAVALGGHLATVRNQAEEDWIFKTFGHYEGVQRLLWIGLSDREKKFHFSWASGESASYTDWAKGEPNNAGHGEDYVSIYYPNHRQANKWNDWESRVADPIGLPMDGVVEIIPKEMNNPASAAPSTASAVANAVAVLINPNIVITSDSGSIKLQWTNSASDYMLEATTNLSEPFTMFGYSELTNIDTGLIYVTITNPVPQMYFRLERP